MNKTIILVLVVLVFLHPTPTFASFHLWNISEIYTNSDGTVQFIELETTVDGQEFISAHDLTATSDGNPSVYTIPTDLIGTTANKKVLFATAGFESQEGGIIPDYIIPDQFFDPTASNISIDFSGVDSLTFTNPQLPTGGYLSLSPDLSSAPNSPTNFAGEMGLLNDVIFKDSFSCGSTFMAYPDMDEDLFGDINASPQLICEPTIGLVDNNLDCDDSLSSINPVAEDNPDQSFVDSNCDGIDGDITKAIFVSTIGDIMNPGTIDEPISSINDGVILASQGTATHVYVATGTYNEMVTLADGVSIYGGYDALNQWSRDSTNSTINSSAVVDIHRVGISGNGILTPTVIDSFDVITSDIVSLGSSNYGIHCVDCNGLVIENNFIDVGDAGHGMPGNPGIGGRNGNNGINGSNGCQDTNCGFGGSQTMSPFGEFGGRGGDGGYDSGSGENGSIGSAGAQPGSGAAGSNCFSGGNNGSGGGAGSNGSDGQVGSNGSGFSIINGFWIGNTGSSGQDGTNGTGGSGGGGGGGGDNAGGICNSDTGGGGGSGGSGGELGTGGLGGLGGGSTFGLFLINSLSAQLSNNLITLGTPGNGGLGGTGGAGGTAGSASSGGGGNDDSGSGGAGGAGGAGGSGGDGGNGADGVAQEIFIN